MVPHETSTSRAPGIEIHRVAYDERSILSRIRSDLTAHVYSQFSS